MCYEKLEFYLLLTATTCTNRYLFIWWRFFFALTMKKFYWCAQLQAIHAWRQIKIIIKISPICEVCYKKKKFFIIKIKIQLRLSCRWWRIFFSVVFVFKAFLSLSEWLKRKKCGGIWKQRDKHYQKENFWVFMRHQPHTPFLLSQYVSLSTIIIIRS